MEKVKRTNKAMNKESILGLLKEGKTIREISDELGFLYASVWTALKRWGISNQRKYTVYDYKEGDIKPLIDAGKTLTEISKELNIPYRSIYLFVKNKGFVVKKRTYVKKK